MAEGSPRRLDYALLIATASVVPLDNRMTLGKGLRQLGIAPCGVQNLLDIIGEKSGNVFQVGE